MRASEDEDVEPIEIVEGQDPPTTADMNPGPWFRMHARRALDSDLCRTASLAGYGAAEKLWKHAWLERPPGSIPGDDRILAQLVGLGRDLEAWRAIKDEALHKFVTCKDGRLYHSVLVQEIIRAVAKRAFSIERAATMRAKKAERRMLENEAKTSGARDWPRDSARDWPRDSARPSTSSKTLDNRQEIVEGKKERTTEPPRQEPARAKSSLVVERVAPETQHLLGKLYAAANNNVDHSDERSRKVGPITDLENEGCDLDLDILPTIKAQVPKMREPLKSWGAPFLADHIRAARDRRLAQATPKPKLTAEEERLQRQRRGSNHRYAHLGRDELIALWRDEQAEYHELEMLEVDLTDPADLAELARRNEAARQFALKLEAKREAQKQAARKDYIAGLIAGNLAWNETIMGKKPSEAEIDAVREEMARES